MFINLRDLYGLYISRGLLNFTSFSFTQNMDLFYGNYLEYSLLHQHDCIEKKDFRLTFCRLQSVLLTL